MDYSSILNKINELLLQYPEEPLYSDENFTTFQDTLSSVTEALKLNREDAQKLWELKDPASQILSLYIEEPQHYTESIIQEKAAEVHSTPVADLYTELIISRTFYDLKLAIQWHTHEEPIMRRMSYRILGQVSRVNEYLEDTFFLEILETIEDLFTLEKDSVKSAMIQCMRGIDSRNEVLKKRTGEIFTSLVNKDPDLAKVSL